jgi:hypothetical protein
MSHSYGDEKVEEKQQEKVAEKQQEKVEEKVYRDPLGSIVGALVLIWAGVVLLGNNVNYLQVFADALTRLGVPPYDWPWEWTLPFVSMRAWQVFFLGAGVIKVGEILVRLIVPRFRREILGTFIGAIVLFALGLGNWVIIGPLIVVAIGVSLLVRGLLHTRR